jgi:hypothetical protein
MNDFWLKWRREIVRGGVLFVAVVAVGLWATNLVRGGRARVMSGLKNTLGALSVDFDAPGRTHGDTWQWRGTLSSTQTIRIRNMNGPIAVERTAGNHAEVFAEKSWEHSAPQSVRLVALPGPSGVTICALWGDQASCDPEGRYEGLGGGGHRNDVAVRFKVLVPKGVAADVTTMNGSLQITGVSGALNASTLNGGIQAEVAGGPVTVKTVNGAIEATLGALAPGGARIETLNGSVTVRLPEHVNATLDAASVVGRVLADLPLQLRGTIDPKHVRGSLGTGGPTLHVSTVNGEIRLLQMGSAMPAPLPATHRKHARMLCRAPPPPAAPPAQPPR